MGKLSINMAEKNAGAKLDIVKKMDRMIVAGIDPTYKNFASTLDHEKQFGTIPAQFAVGYMLEWEAIYKQVIEDQNGTSEETKGNRNGSEHAQGAAGGDHAP